jgi:hypothetical protein
MFSAIATEVQRTHRHSGVAEFVRHMSAVHGFMARGVVCGVKFGRDFMLVNTDRLKRVLFCSKSCMNGCFQRLGYNVMRPSQDIVCLFSRLMPNVNPELFAIRQWCIRLVSNRSVVFFAANLPGTLSLHVHPAMTDTRRPTSSTSAASSAEATSNIRDLLGLVARHSEIK